MLGVYEAHVYEHFGSGEFCCMQVGEGGGEFVLFCAGEGGCVGYCVEWHFDLVGMAMVGIVV